MGALASSMRARVRAGRARGAGARAGTALVSAATLGIEELTSYWYRVASKAPAVTMMVRAASVMSTSVPVKVPVARSPTLAGAAVTCTVHDPPGMLLAYTTDLLPSTRARVTAVKGLPATPQT